MSRLSLLFACCAMLSGCMEPTPQATPGARSDGVAQKLSLGVNRAEAEVALGMDAGFERNPKNFDESCVSYAYGDGPKYVHAVFRGGKLVQRTDGHRALCTYGQLAEG